MIKVPMSKFILSTDDHNESLQRALSRFLLRNDKD